MLLFVVFLDFFELGIHHIIPGWRRAAVWTRSWPTCIRRFSRVQALGEFGVEFWVEGIDDGPNKYTSEVRFLIWNALKDADIEIPFPQREIRYREGHAPS